MIRALVTAVAGVLLSLGSAHALPRVPALAADTTPLTLAVGPARTLHNTPEALALVRCVGRSEALVGTAPYETVVAAAAYLPDTFADRMDVARHRVAATRVRTGPGRNLRTFLADVLVTEAHAIRLPIPDPARACAEWTAAAHGGPTPPWLAAVRAHAPSLVQMQRRSDVQRWALALWQAPGRPRGGLLF